MTVVAVAGGLGDLGRLIVGALVETGKHEVYIMSRKPQEMPARTSPVTGKEYHPILQTDYSEASLAEVLQAKQVSVVISTLIMDSDAASDAQLRLITAADQCPSVRRFIPSEFNIEYDVGDDILPYPEKKYHMIARRALEKTSLEYTFIYPGMFMDYFGMPHVATALRPLYFFIDPASGEAVLPDDGEARMSMTFTTDAARYTALALELDAWPRILSTVTSTVTLNELVRLVEKAQGRELQVRYQPVEKLVAHAGVDLPSNVAIAAQYPARFPGGLAQVRGLVADLEAGVALGAYDLGELHGAKDLVAAFEGRGPAPTRIEDVIAQAWGKA